MDFSTAKRLRRRASRALAGDGVGSAALDRVADTLDAAPDYDSSPGTQSFASRLSSSSMVTPTSAIPPNTVPFLPFSTCSQPVT